MRIGILILLALSSFTASAELKSFCGKLDLRAMSNQNLTDLIFTNDLSQGRTTARIQCGLPKENLPLCSECADVPTPEMMSALREVNGQVAHLKWHERWHNIRALRDLDEDTFKKLKALGDIDPAYPLAEFKNRHLISGGNSSGEDFFYMHRMMIKMLQLEFASRGLPCIAAWKDLPATAADPVWPVPKGAETARWEPELTKLRTQLADVRRQDRLKKMSLNQLGRIVEAGFHLQLHALYRGNPVCSREARAEGYCDDLVPVETSPLNKHFWKIHGLVDEILGEWLSANGFSEIAVDCGGRRGCYNWQGPWVGRYPSN